MKKAKPIFLNNNVKEVYLSFPNNLSDKLLTLRQLIFETAKGIDDIGEIEETLKWGEPSYAPIRPKVGSPIRINRIKGEDKYAIFFNCQSNLVSTFREIYVETFTYEGNRSIVFNLSDKIPLKELSHCISMALTYHQNKKSLKPFK